jgi:heme oxygenase (mycobilin-producing)
MSVRFIMDARVKPGSKDALMEAYAALRDRVAREPELISHQLCEAIDDPEHWIVTSEFQTLDGARAWLRSEDHGKLIGPIRACFSQGQSVELQVRDGVEA